MMRRINLRSRLSLWKIKGIKHLWHNWKKNCKRKGIRRNLREQFRSPVLKRVWHLRIVMCPIPTTTHLGIVRSIDIY